MGRLFWKFLIFYWAALLLVVLGVSMYRLTAQEQERAVEASPRSAFITASAAATLRNGGVSALRDLMEDWAREGDVPLLAVDDAGRDLLGRQVPRESLERARDLVDAGEDQEGVRRVHSHDGGTYLLFIPLQTSSFAARLFGGRPPSPMVPLVIGIFASLAFGALLAWYVSRPIRHLRGALAALSEGRLETRVAPLIGRRRDELADLGRDFDKMAQRLQTLIGAQRTLLHDVSHELRSPLARLQAAIGLARQSPHRTEASLERIEHEADRLDELVGQLLTLSRLEAGVTSDARSRTERTDLADLIASIVADADFEAQAGGRRVVFTGGDGIVAAARVELLHRAVENVVRNAVKHTAEGTSVEVTLATSGAGDAAVVTVSDQGPGVDEEDLEAIFEPFFRGAGGRSGQGFGLGLAIARRAIEAHGGRVSARNRPGGGLIVEIELPVDAGRPTPR